MRCRQAREVEELKEKEFYDFKKQKQKKKAILLILGMEQVGPSLFCFCQDTGLKSAVMPL